MSAREHLPWYAWTLGRKSLALTLFPIVVAAMTIIVMVKALAFNREAEDEVQRGLRVLGQIHAVHAALAEAASGVRGFILTRDETFLEPYLRAEGLLVESLANLEADLKDDIQRQTLLEISELVNIKLGNLATLQSQALTLSPGSVLEYSRDNKVLLDRLRNRIAFMEKREQQIVAALQSELSSARATSQRLIYGTLVGAVILATIFSQRFARDLIYRVRRIRDNAERIGRGSPLLVYEGGPQDEVAELDRLVVRTGATLDEKLAELRDAKAAAEAANMAKTDFLSRTSHELRTPLNAIMGFSELLEHAELPAEQRQRVITIRRSAHHLLQLVNDLLDLSRIETGNLSLVLQSIDLNDALIVARDIVAGRAAAKQVAVQLSVEMAPYVAADAQRLLQILINLMDNAIKFSPPGCPVDVSACASQKDGRPGVTIVVSDQGPGISQGQREQLFSPFQRLNSRVEGVGLGLAISHSLAQQMSGTLEYQSAPVGSRFALWLPEGDGAELADLRSEMANLKTLVLPESGQQRAALHWVLVTDQEPLAVMVETVAARLQQPLTVITSPTQWQHLPAEQPCLLISDMLPEHLQWPSGCHVVRQLFLTQNPPKDQASPAVNWLAPPHTALRLRRTLQEMLDV